MRCAPPKDRWPRTGAIPFDTQSRHCHQHDSLLKTGSRRSVGPRLRHWVVPFPTSRAQGGLASKSWRHTLLLRSEIPFSFLRPRKLVGVSIGLGAHIEGLGGNKRGGRGKREETEKRYSRLYDAVLHSMGST